MRIGTLWINRVAEVVVIQEKTVCLKLSVAVQVHVKSELQRRRRARPIGADKNRRARIDQQVRQILQEIILIERLAITIDITDVVIAGDARLKAICVDG